MPADEETVAKVRNVVFDVAVQRGFRVDDNGEWSVVVDGRLVPTGDTREFGEGAGRETVTAQRLECTLSFRRGEEVINTQSFAVARLLGGSLSVPRGKTAQQAHEADLWDWAVWQLRARLPSLMGASTGSGVAGPGTIPGGVRTGFPERQFTIESALAGLDARSSFDRSAALEFLAKVEPDEAHRGAVSRALVMEWDAGKWKEMEELIPAMANWGTDEIVAAAIARLNDEDQWNRAPAIEALAKLKDKRGADAVALRMTDRWDAQKASAALKQMGPVAEDTAIRLLKDAHWSMRAEACNILAVIGTEKSLASLKRLAKDKSPEVRAAATTAIGAVSARAGK